MTDSSRTVQSVKSVRHIIDKTGRQRQRQRQRQSSGLRAGAASVSSHSVGVSPQSRKDTSHLSIIRGLLILMILIHSEEYIEMYEGTTFSLDFRVGDFQIRHSANV